MDIEGGEVEVLEDILPLFSRMKYLKLAVCLYHRQGDEKRISSLIPDGYKGRIRDGSILFLPSILSGEHKKLKYPFFRRGLIRIDSEYE